MRDAVQSPITYKVTSAIVRGRVDETAIIINQSLTATVWASSNPGMSPGQGTVINPGTFLTWTRKGDVYLILSNDVKSITAGFANVTITYDVADWAPDPVAIASSALNRQTVIAPFNSYTIAQIQAFNVIDTSLFNSLVMIANPTSPTTGGTSILVRQYMSQADALALFTPICTDSWSWYATANGGNQELKVQIPLRGPFVRIDPQGSALWTFESALSSQLVQDIRYGSTTLPKPGVVCDMNQINSGNIAAGPGTSATSYFNQPVGGEIDLYIEVAWAAAITAGALSGWVEIFDRNTATTQNRVILAPMVGQAFAPFAIATYNQRICLAEDQYFIRIANNIATATSAYRVLATLVNHYAAS